MQHIATEQDRAHFCTYEQAQAAMVDGDLPFRSSGQKPVALNLTTGHRIPCADSYMAFGYVAGSAVLYPQWKFVIEMGAEQVGPFSANPQFSDRLRNPNWREAEESARRATAADARLRVQAQSAYDAVMVAGLMDEEY